MYILLIILATLSSFACRNDQVSMVRSSGFGFDTTGNNYGGVRQKVNIPVRFEGEWGCWEQVGGLSFNVEEKKREITVIIPKSKFEDFPGRTMSYAFLSKSVDGVKMDVATFVCAGSTVLSAETYSGDVKNAKILENIDSEVSMVFATGAAAEAIARREEETNRRLGRRTELPGGLEDFFNQNFQGEWSELEKYDLLVPAVYLGANMKSPLSNLSASYSTRVITKSACSPEFESTMAPLKFDSLKMPEGLKVKTKRGDLVIKW